MTSAAVQCSPSGPLDERTNDPSPCNILSPTQIDNQARQKSSRTVRRMDSHRRIIVKSDTDSLPNVDDGIYNASPLSSDEELREDKSPLQDPEGLMRPSTGPTILPTTVLSPQAQLSNIPRSVTLPLSPRSPPFGHSQWPAPHLDTIIEQHGSTRSLRHTISAPRLRSSPERFPQVVKIQDSIHSIRPSRYHQQSWPRPNLHPITGLHHARSFSLNDLVCLDKLMDTDQSLACTPASCTSSEAFNIMSQGPSYPIKPVMPPPERVRTPPGLPSFGTREAQVIRLNPDREVRRRARIFPSWLASSPIESHERVSNVINLAGPVDTSAENRLSSPSEGVLKRLLAASGMSRLVDPVLQTQSEQPRASLPPGVVATGETGFLALAEDGTAIRGRFGNRMSGHGVGQRDLNSHPLARVDRQGAIEDEVHQIDKACVEMNRRMNSEHLQRLPEVPYASIDAELWRRLNQVEQSCGTHIDGSVGDHPDFLSPMRSRLTLPSPAFPSPNLMPSSDIRASSRSLPIPPSNSPTGLSSSTVAEMREPPDYANRARNSMARSDDYVTQREYFRAQRMFDVEYDSELGRCKKWIALFCLKDCNYDTIEKKSILRNDPSWTHRQDYVRRGAPDERRMIRQEVYRRNLARLAKKQRAADNTIRRTDDAAQAANLARRASAASATAAAAASAACATSILTPVVCSQMDGLSSHCKRPRMDEPLAYPPQLDGTKCSLVEVYRKEWRPQTNKSHWWNCCVTSLCYPSDSAGFRRHFPEEYMPRKCSNAAGRDGPIQRDDRVASSPASEYIEMHPAAAPSSTGSDDMQQPHKQPSRARSRIRGLQTVEIWRNL